MNEQKKSSFQESCEFGEHLANFVLILFLGAIFAVLLVIGAGLLFLGIWNLFHSDSFLIDDILFFAMVVFFIGLTGLVVWKKRPKEKDNTQERVYYYIFLSIIVLPIIYVIAVSLSFNIKAVLTSVIISALFISIACYRNIKNYKNKEPYNAKKFNHKEDIEKFIKDNNIQSYG